MFSKKNNFYKEFISVLIILMMLINQLFYPAIIWAEEAAQEGSPQETVSPLPDQESVSESQPQPVSESPPPSPSSTAEPTPEVQQSQLETESQPQTEPPAESATSDVPAAAGSSEITTGEADSASQTDTTVNTTEQTVPGNVDAEGCSVEGSVGCPIDETKIATTSAQSESDATSGQNLLARDGGEGTIATGDSNASSINDNQINTNVIETAPSNGNENNSSSGSSIALLNKATHEAASSAESASGQNQAQADIAEIVTGDSISTAHLVNLINTNIIGSNFDFFVLDLLADENGNINLNEVWKRLEAEALTLGPSVLDEDGDLFIGPFIESVSKSCCSGLRDNPFDV